MRHHSASVIGTDNCVGLPVSDAAFCGDNGRSLIDVDAVRNQPAPRILALPLVVFFAAVTQVKIQLTPVFLVFPDMLIDPLVTDTGDAILRQTTADLIRPPLLLRQFLPQPAPPGPASFCVACPRRTGSFEMRGIVSPHTLPDEWCSIVV